MFAQAVNDTIVDINSMDVNVALDNDNIMFIVTKEGGHCGWKKPDERQIHNKIQPIHSKIIKFIWSEFEIFKFFYRNIFCARLAAWLESHASWLWTAELRKHFTKIFFGYTSICEILVKWGVKTVKIVLKFQKFHQNSPKLYFFL